MYRHYRLESRFQQADLAGCLSRLGLSVPQVSVVSVDGGARPTNGDAQGDDAEVALDIEIAGAIANGARIVAYFAPNTDQGFVDAVTTAVFDDANRPSVISISWGLSWSDSSQQKMTAMDQAFGSAAALGVTVFCSSGDSGSSDAVDDGNAHVDFPASSPHVIACGGTHFKSSANTITSEVVWNNSHGATGGGISDVFGLPGYQAGAGVPPSANGDGRIGRGVPDLAGNWESRDSFPGAHRRCRSSIRRYQCGSSSVGWSGGFDQPAACGSGRIHPADSLRAAFFEADVTHGITQRKQWRLPGWWRLGHMHGLGTPNGEDWLAALIY